MVTVAQVADVKVELQGVLDVQTGQADLLLSQLQKENVVQLNAVDLTCDIQYSLFSVINQEKQKDKLYT